MWWYSFLDNLFLFFHFTLILFILLGWIWARRLHLVVTSMVGVKWDARAVDWTVAAAGVGSFCLSLWVNRRRKASQL